MIELRKIKEVNPDFIEILNDNSSYYVKIKR